MRRRTLFVSAVMAAAMMACPALAAAQATQAASAPALNEQEQIQATAQKRAGKIMAELALTDEAKAAKVNEAIVEFYVKRIGWGEKDDQIVVLTGQLAEAQKAGEQAKADEIAKKLKALKGELVAMRKQFEGDLGKELTAEQIVTVKDVMTYKRVPGLYKVFCDRHELTDEQKAAVLQLLEAVRDDGMMQGSSEAKHNVFRKAIGRVNIYLDAKKKYAVAKAAIQAGNLDEAVGPLTKLEKGKDWMMELMGDEIAELRKAYDAAKAGEPAAATGPTTQPSDN